MIDARRRQLFRLLWNDGRLSRSEIHVRTGMTPNGVGLTAEAMLREGLLRECPASSAGAGRPRVPLEIDPTRRHVIGLSLHRGHFEICRLSLSGEVVERIHGGPERPLTQVVSAAASRLAAAVDERTIGVGVTVTGFVDPDERTLLLNTAAADRLELKLAPFYAAAGALPLIIENDMHALAARWMLTRRADPQQDVVLAWIEDGHMGATLLINGRPNRGCATGANDLGHLRFFIDTERCFCGQSGCLERIFSSGHLASLDAKRSPPGAATAPAGTLAERAAAYVAAGHDRSLDCAMEYLACGLANVANFIRPHRLILASSLMRHAAFGDALTRATRALILPQLASRATVERWDVPPAASAEMAAWLAMAELLCGGWNDADRTTRSEAEVAAS